jgi:hypothetical protein
VSIYLGMELLGPYGELTHQQPVFTHQQPVLTNFALFSVNNQFSNSGCLGGCPMIQFYSDTTWS